MRTNIVRRAIVPLLFATCAVATPGAQTAQRLSDKDVKEIFEAVHQGRDRFEDQLDGKLKRSVVRGPRGEVNVEEYLDDLQDNVNKLRERFKSNYSASAEATTVLRQASDIHRFIKSQPAELKGGSEWDRLVADLTRLAQAYNTTFPLPPDGSARRINDDEASKAAAAVAKQANELKDEINKETGCRNRSATPSGKTWTWSRRTRRPSSHAHPMASPQQRKHDSSSTRPRACRAHSGAARSHRPRAPRTGNFAAASQRSNRPMG